MRFVVPIASGWVSGPQRLRVFGQAWLPVCDVAARAGCARCWRWQFQERTGGEMTDINDIYRELLERIGPVLCVYDTLNPKGWRLRWNGRSWCRGVPELLCQFPDKVAHVLIKDAWQKWCRKNDPDHEWIICPDDKDWWIVYRWNQMEDSPVQVSSTPSEPEAMLAVVDKVLKEKTLQ